MSGGGDEDGGRGQDARLAALGVARLLAGNASAYTLSGTNTWIVGRDPAYVVDPGPDEEPHVQRLIALLSERGGLGGVALTHDHADHAGALPALLAQMRAPVAAARPHRDGGGQQRRLVDGESFGPLRALSAPGHSSDHLAFLAGSVCLSGDAVLGEGSVFLTPDPGALSGYLRALRRLAELPLQVICPGHGPPVWQPRARLREYLEHRLDRERRLRAALDEGRRSVGQLLDYAWSEVPDALRPLATITLAAHLDKLAEEGGLPPDVQRPQVALPPQS